MFCDYHEKCIDLLLSIRGLRSAFKGKGGERGMVKNENAKTFHLSLLAGCLTFQQQASVSQGRICSDNFTCCHTEIEVADQTVYLTQYTDTGPTSPSADPIRPGAWQGSHWSANLELTGMTRPRKIPAQAGFEPGIFRSRGGRLTTRPKRRSSYGKRDEHLKRLHLTQNIDSRLFLTIPCYVQLLSSVQLTS